MESLIQELEDKGYLELVKPEPEPEPELKLESDCSEGKTQEKEEQEDQQEDAQADPGKDDEDSEEDDEDSEEDTDEDDEDEDDSEEDDVSEEENEDEDDPEEDEENDSESPNSPLDDDLKAGDSDEETDKEESNEDSEENDEDEVNGIPDDPGEKGEAGEAGSDEEENSANEYKDDKYNEDETDWEDDSTSEEPEPTNQETKQETLNALKTLLEELSRQEDWDITKRIQSEIIELSKLVEEHALCPYTKRDTETVPKKDKEAYEKLKKAAEKHISVARTKLTLALQAMTRSQMQRDIKKGKLDCKRLRRLATRTSTRIFKKKVLGEGLNTAVSFVVDMSYSMMTHDRLETAKKLCVIFGETLSRIPGVRFEIVGSNTGERATGSEQQEYTRINKILYHKVHQFDENWTFSHARVGGLYSKSNCVTNEFILWAARRLAQQNTNRKILITLEDGEPYCSPGLKSVFSVGTNQVKTLQLGAALREDQKKNADYVRRSGIEVYCISINSKYPETIYGADHVINVGDYDETVDNKFFSLLSNILLS